MIAVEIAFRHHDVAPVSNRTRRESTSLSFGRCHAAMGGHSLSTSRLVCLRRIEGNAVEIEYRGLSITQAVFVNGESDVPRLHATNCVA